MNARLRALGRNLQDYLTPVRALLLIVAAIGLLLLAVPGGWIGAFGVLLSVSALALLLAQINTQSREAFPNGVVIADDAIEQAAQPAPLPSRGPALVSVIIPGKNEAEFAADCITSLKNQTLTRFEAIIVDDGSTDATLDVVLDAVDGDPRFRIYRSEQSLGPGTARNAGVSVAATDLVAFLDLDDFLAPTSLETRFRALEQFAHEPWLAGVYSWHQGVARSARYEHWVPSDQVATMTQFSWLDRPDDNVFVVSAPLLKKDAFVAVGGFGDDIGEDARLWLGMLRAGFTFRGTGTIDIAYRQKPQSRAASDYLGMHRSVAQRIEEGEHARPLPEGVSGPYWFDAPIADYRTARALANRLSASLGMAVALGHTDEASHLVNEIGALPAPMLAPGWVNNAVAQAKGGATRVALSRDNDPELPAWQAEVERLLQPAVEAAVASARTWQENVPSLKHGATLEQVRPHSLVEVTATSIGSITQGQGKPFLIMPSAAYHTDELIHLVPELRRRGYAPVAMINDFRWTTTGSAMARVDMPVVDVIEPGPWLDGFAGVMVFNDWGEYYADTVEYLANKPIATFAKVEGVQDWHDRDTGRIRNAYLGADIILCQGDNDVDALTGRREGLEVVGSDRLERIWRDPLPADGDPSVVANVNFTYGVLTEHRDLWVNTTLAAAEAAGLPITLSMHPSERASYPGLSSDSPLRHLLTTESIFVSRFSTAIWEALARGCNTIYYNPHGEQVETFQQTDGAFTIARSQHELEGAMRQLASRSREDAKRDAAAAFASQVSMDEARSVAERTADVIDRYTKSP